MLELIVVLVGGYLLGSIPFAYLLVRISAKADVLRDGSGYAGAYNAYVVSQSRATGIVVGVLDALKGLTAVYLAGLYAPGSYWLQSIGLLAAIGGHVFPLWTRFKGGRGLATTAGGMTVLGFAYALIWCTLWVLVRLLKKDILWANVVAILLSPLFVWMIPWEVLSRLNLAPIDHWAFIFLSCVISLALLGSHLDALRDIWQSSPQPEKQDSST